MRRAVRNILRLLQIARTLARHDALFALEWFEVAPAITLIARAVSRRRVPGRPGERLAAAFQALGPGFIKFGQALSVRSDLLGETLAEDLSALQDRLPPFPAAEARRTVEEELGRPVDEIYAEFDDRPVAAASIAQVHFAVDAAGNEVAVKILRPGVEQAFERDLDLLFWIADILERTQPALRRLKPVEVVRTFAESVRIEMDLRLEAAAASELRENFADDPTYRVPRVDWQRTSRRVLTLERIHGIPIDEKERLIEAGHDIQQILTAAATVFFKQAFRDGFFHADQHPGNLFVAPDGALVAVDFGIMGRLDRPTRIYLAEMLLGFLNGDYRHVAKVHFAAGFVPESKSVDAFAQACRSIGEPILGRPLHEISLARLLAQLFQITETFEMETQPQLLLLQKTMVVVEGVGRSLDPEVNVWALARPLIEDWIRENRGPEARVRDTVAELASGLERLPRLIADTERLVGAAAEGGLRLHPDTVRALAGERRPDRGLLWPLWLVVGLLAAILLALL